MTDLALQWSKDAPPEKLLDGEWLVTNGLGGYAAGTIAGACTRRFHGLLVAALPAPLGRTMMLNHLAEELILPGGRTLRLGGEERPGVVEIPGACELAEFALEHGLPMWRYEVDGVVLEKRILLPHLQNTVHISYRLVSSPGVVGIRLRPSLYFRPHEGAVAPPIPAPYRVTAVGPEYEVCGPPQYPALRLRMFSDRQAQCILDGGSQREIFYRVESARGYDSQGSLWSPGYMKVELQPEQEATLVASVEPWQNVGALVPAHAQKAERERRQRLLASAGAKSSDGIGADLVFAADQFIITPNTRVVDAARAHAAGDDARTVIAGYHWFTDWGRDTMISLEGLTLTTGRHAEAGYILRTFARYVRDGLIPNLFPEGEGEGLYHTADATLWFFHAVHRYVETTGDRETLRQLLPVLLDIVQHHMRGTRFGIGVDPVDGLLRQGAEGYQLTWMDAKVDGWVVTPRRGKAVEINALFYNALRLLEGWLREESGDDAAAPIRASADRVKESFQKRFWYEEGGYLYDVVDCERGGNDTALRPNQIFALSLAHEVLDRGRWQQVLDVVHKKLVTPVGLRSLAPGQPDYKSRYDGDLRSRDAAYHQGTVWAWLIGPFVDAWLKVHPEDKAGARQLLAGFEPHLRQACIGSISEIFDAEAPFLPRGCVAQAWSVAEVLRCLVKTKA